MEKENKLTPKGFYYAVTDEQIKRHQQLTFLQVFEWLESTNAFLARFQTPEEKERMQKIRMGTY